jgi:hypothetical protein
VRSAIDTDIDRNLGFSELLAGLSGRERQGQQALPVSAGPRTNEIPESSNSDAPHICATKNEQLSLTH